MTYQPAGRGRAHLFGIFTVSFAVLAFQVLLTRLFSVMLYYHFAFAGVSIVMLGLTIGAQRVYLDARRFSAERLDLEFSSAAMHFAASSILAVLWFIYLPLLVPQVFAMALLSLSLILFTIPLVYSGICVTLILMRSRLGIGPLYAADLIGAAAGCVGIVILLFLLDPISIFLAISGLVAFTAVAMAPSGSAPRRQAKWLTAAFCALCVGQSAAYLSGHTHLRVIWAKGNPQTNVFFERWNAISRIRVYPYADALPQAGPGPFGWGFGHSQNTPIDQIFLDIDAQAGTVLTHFDGYDLSPLSFLANDVVNAAYHVRHPRNVAVIGVGGGRDVLSALSFGVDHVTGIELNPAIFEVLTGPFAAFTGHLAQRHDVSLINAEARSWINASHQSFDLVQISLIDTWAATAAGGLTMTENKLYTVDAWKEFMARMPPTGMLEVARWFDPRTHRSEFYRLLSVAAEALKARGVPPGEIRSHILAFTANSIVTVVISPGAFTSAEIARAQAAAKAEGFGIVLDPTTAFDATSATIASGMATPAFYDALAVDVTAPTDNRPFFFYTWKPLHALRAGPDTGVKAPDPGANNLAIKVMGFLLASTLAAVGVFIVGPLRAATRQAPVRAMAPYLGYFAGIGIGFMMIEISQMQRLIVFLGDPVYGLTVLLFTLLLFGGLGSLTLGGPRAHSALWRRPALCCAVLCLVGFVTPDLTAAVKGFGVAARILASVALLAPAGFCMGMMFPTGMEMSRRFADQQAWFWGVNGATSVFASVLGMAVSMEYGIAQAHWAGVVCYFACLVVVLRLTRAGERAHMVIGSGQAAE